MSSSSLCAPARAVPCKDPVDEWIASLIPQRSFVDIGGIGVGAVNERVTMAVQAGASRAAMADIRPFSHHDWTAFFAKCAAMNTVITDCFEGVDVTSPEIGTKLPVFDVVNCAGILYHLPHPLDALRTLKQVVGEYLIVNTVTVPARIANSEGILEYGGNVALFLPGLSPRERAILGLHYRSTLGLSLDEIAPRLDQTGATMPYVEDGELSYWPYWWLMSDQCFRSALQLMGFAVLDEWKWKDHCLFCLCKRQEPAR